MMTSIRAVKIIAMLTGFFCFIGPVYGADAPSANRITILRAEYSAQDGKAKIEVAGETDLPKGSVLSIYVRKGSELTAYKEIKADSGKFEAALGPIEKTLEGEYSVQVMFSPEQQPPEVTAALKGSSPDRALRTVQAVSLFKAAKTSEEKNPFGIEIGTSLEQYGGMVILHADGKTGLPDGAVLKVFLKRIDSVIVFGECVVSRGEFSISFGPFGKEFTAGAYTVEADFFPDIQKPELRKIAERDKIPASIGRCEVVIGRTSDAQKAEGSAKKEVGSAVSALDELYWELKDVYAMSLNHYDSGTWDEWSDRWRFRLKKVSNSFKDETKKERAASLYPEADRGIPVAVKYLSELYTVMADTLKGRAAGLSETKKADLEKRGYVLDLELKKLLDKMKAELASSPAGVNG